MTPYSVPALYMYIFNYVGNCQLSGVPVQVCPGWPRTAIGVGLDQKLSGFAATHSHSFSGQLSRASLHPEALRPVNVNGAGSLLCMSSRRWGQGFQSGVGQLGRAVGGKVDIKLTLLHKTYSILSNQSPSLFLLNIQNCSIGLVNELELSFRPNRRPSKAVSVRKFLINDQRICHVVVKRQYTDYK